MTNEEKHKLRDKALTELFNSGILQKKIDRMFQSKGYPREADIQSDCLQHCFVHLMQYDLDELVKMYKDNKKRLVGLAVTIIKNQCITIDPRSEYSWRNQLAPRIFKNSGISMIKEPEPIEQPEEPLDADAFNERKEREDEIEQRFKRKMKAVIQQLTPEENKRLKKILSSKGKLTKPEKAEYLKLLTRIKRIGKNIK